MGREGDHQVLEDGHFKLVSCGYRKDSKTFVNRVLFNAFGVGENHTFEGERALEKRELGDCIRCDIRNVLSVRMSIDEENTVESEEMHNTN